MIVLLLFFFLNLCYSDLNGSIKFIVPSNILCNYNNVCNILLPLLMSVQISFAVVCLLYAENFELG